MLASLGIRHYLLRHFLHQMCHLVVNGSLLDQSVVAGLGLVPFEYLMSVWDAKKSNLNLNTAFAESKISSSDLIWLF